MNDTETTRRQFLAALSVAGAATLGAEIMLMPSETVAAGPAQQGTATPLPPGIKSVQGSWLGILSGRGTSRGLATFTSNGGLVTTNQGDTLLSRPQGGGHGIWRQDGRHVETRIVKFVGNDKGVLTSILEETTSGDLDEIGDTLVLTASYKIYDLKGTVLESATGTVTAKRITLSGPLDFGD